jgi:hypothetical protein
MNDSPIPKKVMGGCFGGRRFVRKPRSRWEDAVCRDAVDILQARNWKAAGRKREGCRKEIGEAMARTRAKAP